MTLAELRRRRPPLAREQWRSAICHVPRTISDDTPVPVLDRTLPQTRTVRFWVYVGDVRNPYVVYDYTPRRTRDGPERFLEGFRGYLQADAFSGYDRMCAGPDVIEVACWAHVRRKFFELRTSAPMPAHAALARIRQLYG